MRTLFLATALLYLVAPGASRAQTIRGTVRDDVSGRALAGAAVLLTDVEGTVRAATRSAEDGSFVLESVAGDTVRVRSERVGYEAMETKPWVLARSSVLEMELRLRPAPVALDTFTVAGRRRSRNAAGFEQRRGMEIWGRFADAERLSRVRSPRAIDRLRLVIPSILAAPDGTVRVRTKGVNMLGMPSCQPRYYIDGVRYPGDISLDALVSGTSIRAVEFYDNPIQAPAQFSMGVDLVLINGVGLDGNVRRGPVLKPPCAIIVIWTDVGFGEAGA
jgi:hypothetical protein